MEYREGGVVKGDFEERAVRTKSGGCVWKAPVI